MKIIKKKTGNFLEDLKAGQVFRHKGGKTITEGLFNDFTEFNFTTNPLSKNVEFAKAYGYQGLVCPPGMVMNVVFSQTVEDISENARANLGYVNMRFGVPLYRSPVGEANVVAEMKGRDAIAGLAASRGGATVVARRTPPPSPLPACRFPADLPSTDSADH